MARAKVTKSGGQKAAETKRRKAVRATKTARKAVDARVRRAAGDAAVLTARAKRAWKTRKNG